MAVQDVMFFVWNGVDRAITRKGRRSILFFGKLCKL